VSVNQGSVNKNKLYFLLKQGVSVRESSQSKNVEPKMTELKFKKRCKFARAVKTKKHKRNGPETSVAFI
jgi:hypothetical protein